MNPYVLTAEGKGVEFIVYVTGVVIVAIDRHFFTERHFFVGKDASAGINLKKFCRD